MNQIRKLLDGSVDGQFGSLKLYSHRIYKQVGILRGRKKIWHCCKNSLELIRQSMHIFTNIWRGDGVGREKYII